MKKKIIAEYLDAPLSSRRIEQGCPESWPSVHRRIRQTVEHNIGESELGSYRDVANGAKQTAERQVLATALGGFKDELERLEQARRLFGKTPDELRSGG